MQDQTCHFHLTKNLNWHELKSEYIEKNLNPSTKIALLYKILHKIQSKKILNFSKFQDKNLNDSD